MEGGGGIPLETLKEESQSRHVLPANFEVNSLQKSNWGFLLTGLVGGTLVAVYAVATPFVTPALRKVCLPFVPATTKQIENVVKMLRCRRGSLVDIGSGDGRIVIAAAKKGFTAVGYELNPWLVWYSRYRAWREGVHGSAKFYISDLWKYFREEEGDSNFKDGSTTTKNRWFRSLLCSGEAGGIEWTGAGTRGPGATSWSQWGHSVVTSCLTHDHWGVPCMESP
ncbi:ATP synthase subunit C lysine N-methyltransferase isoform X1 [Pan troglodytes]|uniref:ATP synthase subunit C lysine N-methyltransferase isoform X1 n=1 Tax=Pan troglodytes TaxID=9598 RepID=UPI0007DB8FF1|nr:ATP synthase subunit C lysine N-methyltransferase isoform X1 [Pan troglodytes]